jgi:hypothetical protein
LGPSVPAMEQLFSIEGKSFRFSSKEGSSLLRLEERRKKFVGYIFVSTQGSSWLIDTMEAASQAKENITKSFHDEDKALMVHGGSNKAGRYLEVSVYAEGGLKGVLWLPEGRFRWGWRRFAGELRLMLASPRISLIQSWPSLGLHRVRKSLRPSMQGLGSLRGDLRLLCRFCEAMSRAEG